RSEAQIACPYVEHLRCALSLVNPGGCGSKPVITWPRAGGGRALAATGTASNLQAPGVGYRLAGAKSAGAHRFAPADLRSHQPAISSLPDARAVHGAIWAV